MTPTDVGVRLSRLRDVLGVSRPFLSVLWRSLGDVLGFLWAISEALEASRKAKMAQGALEYILGANLGPT